ncbi:LLM class flavin-dependent oxidoreductase [Phytopseudomonas daroniae]|uniref:LLM class flavin-dependent oxidoreductase n=1 Tax=Phytopseudomonas daroniae TaxID=2487519 RepID=UPI001038309C|nr:LLM class flavin-dependent oxidoreductase [Pseudomonas daroniae]TBU73513.1 LLM class flavin-dependent oxidoreductase [Pseudomonas daroniae]
MPARQLRFGAILTGVGSTQNDWKHPDLKGDESVDINWYRRLAQQAEAAKFDYVFIVDSVYITPDTTPHFLNRLEPLTLLSAVAGATEKIGLVGTLTTSYNHPFNVARRFASLDLISNGRAGWNVVTTGLEGAAGNYGREQHFDHGERYRRAHEHVAVVKGLWDSYEDDAFPRDKANDRFLDKSRLHALDHEGEFYSVAGPLNIARSRQGQPVIFQAGISETGRHLAGEIAEGIYAGVDNFEEAQAYYRDIKQRAKAAGRNPDHVLLFPGIVPIIADTDEEARRIERSLNGELDLDKALVQLGRPFNYHDFSRYDLDAPFPELGDLGSNGYRGHAERIQRIARDKGLTLRQAALYFSERASPFVGTAQRVADEIERWFREEAVDGFNIRVTAHSEFAKFTDQVLPLLRERGLFRDDYQHDTLRGHLGLPVPGNRHTLARQQSTVGERTPVA